MPLLTILTGRPLGGLVFGAVIPLAMLVVVGQFFPLSGDSAAWTIVWYGTVVVSACGLLALFQMFVRLEVAGAGTLSESPDVAVARAIRPAGDATFAARESPRGWLRLVIAKELRLQQLTFVMSALYVLLAVGIVATEKIDPLYTGPSFYAITGLHGIAIVLIAGAQASSEERHTGALTAMLLLPRSAALQWVVKVAVVVGVGLLLAAGLPVLLTDLLQPADAFSIEWEFVGASVLICVLAIYVSSLSTTGLWALLASVPAMAAAFAAVAVISRLFVRTVQRSFDVTLVSAITPAMRASS